MASTVPPHASLAQKRLELLRQLLAAGAARTQEELRQALLRKGLRASQPTISADLRRLGAVRTASGYQLPEQPSDTRHASPSTLEQALAALLLDAQPAAALVVLRTGPGKAGALAAELDAAPPPGVVGSIAGDDTVFLATASPRTAASLARRLRRQAGLA